MSAARTPEPLELEMMEVISELKAAIVELEKVQIVARAKDDGEDAPHGKLGDLPLDWLFGGPGYTLIGGFWVPNADRTTILHYPWEDPSGWTEVGSGGD